MISQKFNGSRNGGKLDGIDNHEEENESMTVNYHMAETSRLFQRPGPGPDVQPVPTGSSGSRRIPPVPDRKIRRGPR